MKIKIQIHFINYIFQQEKEGSKRSAVLLEDESTQVN